MAAAGKGWSNQCAVSGWREVVAVSAGEWHSLGLRADGTVVATGDNGKGQCAVSSWQDVVAISAGDTYSLGLRADGTMLVAGEFSQRDQVLTWRNIGPAQGE